jgi:hypothetical protein
MFRKEWLILSFLTFLTVLAWVFFDVYHAATTSTITPIQEKRMKPLSPKFDEMTILEVLERGS